MIVVLAYAKFSFTDSKCFVSYQKKTDQVSRALSLLRSLANSGRAKDISNVAMADSLEESWKDLNSQLETRRILLDTSVAFHSSAEDVSTILLIFFILIKYV